jgi:hypothetical protein
MKVSQPMLYADRGNKVCSEYYTIPDTAPNLSLLPPDPIDYDPNR